MIPEAQREKFNMSLTSCFFAIGRIGATIARGTGIVFIGMFGYSLALSALVAPVVQRFIPDMGTWVGPHEFILAGVPHNTETARELAGLNFIYLMLFLAFVFGTATTIVLRKISNSSRMSERVA